MLSRIINLSVCSAKSMTFSKNVSVMRPITAMSFHTSNIARGFEEFYDQSEKNELLITGRAWTAADLRRKSFDDLHKLWYVLYKERNLLLTNRAKLRRNANPIPIDEENRYMKVKRSMAAIKLVLDERKKIDALLEMEEILKKVDSKDSPKA